MWLSSFDPFEPFPFKLFLFFFILHFWLIPIPKTYKSKYQTIHKLQDLSYYTMLYDHQFLVLYLYWKWKGLVFKCTTLFPISVLRGIRAYSIHKRNGASVSMWGWADKDTNFSREKLAFRITIVSSSEIIDYCILFFVFFFLNYKRKATWKAWNFSTSLSKISYTNVSYWRTNKKKNTRDYQTTTSFYSTSRRPNQYEASK